MYVVISFGSIWMQSITKGTCVPYWNTLHYITTSKLVDFNQSGLSAESLLEVQHTVCADLLTQCSSFAQLSTSLMSDRKECSKFVVNMGRVYWYWKLMMTLLRSWRTRQSWRAWNLKWGQRKGLLVTETAPSLDCVILCVAIAAKISLRNLWHTRVTVLPIFSPHTAKLIKECVCQLLQHSFRFVQWHCSLCFLSAAEKSVWGLHSSK